MQLDLASYLTSVAVSPTGSYMACGDAEGVIHMLSQADEDAILPLNGFDGTPVPWADTAAALPDIEWTDSTYDVSYSRRFRINIEVFIRPLNSLGLPYYDTQLLSSWTAQFVSTAPHYPPVVKIPAQILSTMKTNDTVAYAALPKELKGRRNMTTVGPRKQNARFRSGKSRANEVRAVDKIPYV